MKSFIYAREKRILQIAHNHPKFSPGGTELTALALHHEALKRGMDSWFLGALERIHAVPNAGTQMVALSEDNREAALFAYTFRRFDFAQIDSEGFLWELRTYLKEIKPEIVHIHHLLNFGLESLFLIRNVLPDAEIILTLHDYYAICANNGQLFKHELKERCNGPELNACMKCFPERTANDFTMRRLAFENALSLCDRLISPSEFLKEKIETNLTLKAKIEVVENGYFGPLVEPTAVPEQHNNLVIFGYMGNISAVKGLSDLLDAAEILVERGNLNFKINVYGSQLFEDSGLADRIAESRKALGSRIRYFGKYDRDDVPKIFAGFHYLVFPSVWWENAPLVIYEALYHQRQVICYPHGGAPEILRRYSTGTIATSSDPEALADAMEIAATFNRAKQGNLS